MKKQNIQSLIERINVELDIIQKEKFESDSALNLILNNNIERVQYLDFLRTELVHLLGYFERQNGTDLENSIEKEKKAAKEYFDIELVALEDNGLKEITIEQVAKIKSNQAYLNILNGKMEF